MRVKTVGDCKIGDVFRKWDGTMCRLLMKNDARAVIESYERGRYEVSLSSEVLEILSNDSEKKHAKKGAGDESKRR